jgi:glutamate-1-semialdehyde 2,1-aminomutase/spore coat polysaccharide biosynthesis protein SpsF
MTTAVIVQARIGSTRLPGKVMLDLAGKPVLAHVLDRCRRITEADVVVCATPDAPACDPLVDLARACGVEVFRGPEEDVLARHLGAAKAMGASTIVRITSDCPLIDPEICDEVIRLRARSNVDYVSNNLIRSYPHGLDCEVFTIEALSQAAASALEPEDRQHVTPWMRHAPKLSRANLSSNDASLARYRWTLDYPEDLAMLRELFLEFPPDRLMHMRDVLEVLARRPELAEVNSIRFQRGPTDFQVAKAQ